MDFALLLQIIGISSLVGIPTIAYIVNDRRKVFGRFDSIEKKTDRNHDCIERLEQKIDDQVNSRNRIIQEHKIDVQEDKITLQKQIDSVKSDVKNVLSRMVAISEKVSESEKIHQEMKDMIREQQKFFVDWIQRIEDVTRDNPDFVLTRRRRKRAS